MAHRRWRPGRWALGAARYGLASAVLLAAGSLLTMGTALEPRCAGETGDGKARPAASAEPSTPARDETSPETIRDLRTAVTDVADEATLGAVVVDRATGDQVLDVNPRRSFHTASLVKLLIAIDTLERSRDKAATADRVDSMLRTSDDDVASALWVAGGASAIVARMAERIGLADTRPPEDPAMWGYTRTTARDVAAVYNYLLREAPDRQRDVIVTALAGTSERAADGWPQHFGIPAATPGPWAVKQGWSNTGTQRTVHSTGLVGQDWRHVVVLLVESPLRTSWAALRDAVTSAARTVVPLTRA